MRVIIHPALPSPSTTQPRAGHPPSQAASTAPFLRIPLIPALVSALVGDANAVVAAFAVAELDEPAAAALALLALVAGQDVEPAEGCDGRWRIARKVAPDRVISTVDPQARHTRKSQSNRKDGSHTLSTVGLAAPNPGQVSCSVAFANRTPSEGT
jgi:hypothetical protein